MLGKIIAIFIVASVVYGSVNHVDLTEALISSGSAALELTLTLISAMTLWGGIMGVARSAGLWEWLSKITAPLLRLIFNGLDKGSEALKAISMNLTANMLGLGNAATPLGIKAMQELEKEESCGEAATLNMQKLAVMNSSGLQILPTTVGAMRLAAGSSKPMEIIPCVIAVSVTALTVSLCLVSILYRGKRCLR